MRAHAGTIRWLAAGLLALAAGCAPGSDIELSFDRLSWSERLRPDLGPLDTVQRQETLVRFSDGGAQGQRLISPLYPAIPEVQAGQMPLARTLWIRDGTPLLLSYEVVVYEPLLNGQRPALTTQPYGNVVDTSQLRARQAAVGRRGVTLPMDRRYLVGPGGTARDILNENLTNSGGLLGYESLIGVAFETCNPDDTRPVVIPLFGQGERPRPDCVRTLVDRTLCGGGTSAETLLPATVLRCPVMVHRDSALRLRVVDVNDVRRPGAEVLPGTTQLPFEGLPVVRVVAGPRTLPRRAEFLREECRMPDGIGGERDCDAAQLDRLRLWRECQRLPGQIRERRAACQAWLASGQGLSPAGFVSIGQLWTFSVADPATGRFQENFLPDLPIRKIKFFVSDAQLGGQRYLRAEGRSPFFDDLAELRMVVEGTNGARIANIGCAVVAEPGTGHAMVDSASCPELFRGGPNPAWVPGRPEFPISWRAIFRHSGETVTLGRFCHPDCRDITEDNTLRRDFALDPARGNQVFLEFLLE